MLTEARDIGEELGDTELQAEAMAWRVPAFVAARRHRFGASRGRRDARRWPSITKQPFNLHVAEHYGAAIALSDGQLDAAEGRGAQRPSRPGGC